MKSLGKRSNPPVMMLHGFMGSSEDWRPIATQLADDFLCILPDLPGHGDNTGWSMRQEVTFDGVIGWLHAWLTMQMAEPIHLVGYSMGGRLALYFALMYPEFVASLVLEGSSPGLSDLQERHERQNLDEERAEQIETLGLDAFVEGWYEAPLFETIRQQPTFEAMKARRKQNDPLWMSKIIRELSPGKQPPLGDRLPRLSMPVMLFAGVDDKKYNALINEMGQQIPHSTVVLVPEAGHNTHFEQPEVFTSRLRAFLRREAA